MKVKNYLYLIMMEIICGLQNTEIKRNKCLYDACMVGRVST